jgi:hypothetical protein
VRHLTRLLTSLLVLSLLLNLGEWPHGHEIFSDLAPQGQYAVSDNVAVDDSELPEPAAPAKPVANGYVLIIDGASMRLVSPPYSNARFTSGDAALPASAYLERIERPPAFPFV